MSEENQPCEVPLEEQCASTLEHYERLATLAHEWNNQVPQAIKAWYAAKSTQSETKEIYPMVDADAETATTVRGVAPGSAFSATALTPERRQWMTDRLLRLAERGDVPEEVAAQLGEVIVALKSMQPEEREHFISLPVLTLRNWEASLQGHRADCSDDAAWENYGVVEVHDAIKALLSPQLRNVDR